MTNLELLPKWIMKRYLILWDSIGSSEFDLDLAVRLLGKMKKPDNKKIVLLFLSELRKSGWLETKFDPDDARKRVYKLRSYKDVFEKIVDENMEEKIS